MTGSRRWTWPCACFGDDGVSDAEYYRGRAVSRRRIAEQGLLGAWFGAFAGGRLVSQLGLFRARDRASPGTSTSKPIRRRARRGLAGTLVWSAGRYGLDQLGAHALVIVADPAEEPIRLYRSVGFADAEGQLSLCRPPARLRR